MLSALTFIKAGFGLLAKVPWWVWPIVVLALWGAFGHHKANGLQKQVDTAAAEHRARLAMAEEVGRMLKSSAARLKGIREGKYQPRPNCASELAAAREAIPCTTSPESPPPIPSIPKPIL